MLAAACWNSSREGLRLVAVVGPIFSSDSAHPSVGWVESHTFSLFRLLCGGPADARTTAQQQTATISWIHGANSAIRC
jgi:hypothetical protein